MTPIFQLILVFMGSIAITAVIIGMVLGSIFLNLNMEKNNEK